MFGRWNGVTKGQLNDLFEILGGRLHTLEQWRKQVEKRVEFLEQENASLKERLQALEDTVRTNKTVE
jgi:transposase